MGTVTRLGGLMDQRDEDWRDTLFYWHGKLSWVGGERNVMSWRGTWLSTVSSWQPPLSEFASSFNFFELNFDVRNASHANDLSQGKWTLDHFRGLAGDFRGHYLMEPPDGTGYRRAYRDEQHEFCFGAEPCELFSSNFETTTQQNFQNNQSGGGVDVGGVADDVAMNDAPTVPRTNNALMDVMFPVVAHLQQQRQQAAPLPPGDYVLVAARGTNEFGSFVALGHARRTRGPQPQIHQVCPQLQQPLGGTTVDDGVELTLARRYVRDDDSRLKWPLSELLKSVGLSPTRRSKVAPWEHSLPCRLPSDVIAADAKREAELGNTMADVAPQASFFGQGPHHTRALPPRDGGGGGGYPHFQPRGAGAGASGIYGAEMARKRPRD
eukprot:CAMPEP_0118916048 /NCGR_PEP_ID=MMETSP1166-20130328/16124_1 /TAXON_ID=1104430 /ORGANISM="Chrysoreinhardia sp, Strain CCMP3193" /LENGTH=379 /DNA_ID=CAMNT_0006855839 /DNA_START=423 /DNA_END=1562 /DNA_ORIENTATION=-